LHIILIIAILAVIIYFYLKSKSKIIKVLLILFIIFIAFFYLFPFDRTNLPDVLVPFETISSVGCLNRLYLDLKDGQILCSNRCEEAKSRNYTTGDQWRGSEYCSERIDGIDLNEDGEIGSGERNLYCWEDPINVVCGNITCD
jgi:hypothetical protein